MDLGGAMKNPVVWGGGALLGIILLLKPHAAAATTSQATDAIQPTVISANVAMNAAALGAQVQDTQIAATLAAQKYSLDVADHASVLHFLENADNNNAVVANSRIVSDAGIAQALIQSSTAIIVDQSNNATRLGLGAQSVATAQIQANSTVDVAKLQSQATIAASHNNLIGTIVGSIAKVVGTGMMAFA